LFSHFLPVAWAGTSSSQWLTYTTGPEILPTSRVEVVGTEREHGKDQRASQPHLFLLQAGTRGGSNVLRATQQSRATSGGVKMRGKHARLMSRAGDHPALSLS